MIKISTEFKTDNKKLDALYCKAKDILFSSVKQFGDYKVATSSAEGNTVTLNESILCAETLVRFDPLTAMNTVKAFFHCAKENGRLPSAIVKHGEGIYADFSGFSHFSFVEEAISIFYMEKKKEVEYLDTVYEILKRFDRYIFFERGLNKNGFAELLSAKENVEGDGALRYAPINLGENDDIRMVSPYPVESAVLTGFLYRLKRALTELSMIRGDGEAIKYRGEAVLIFEQIKNKFFIPVRSASYDRNSRGGIIDALTLDALLLMYYGALDEAMAEKFVKGHLFNPEEFYTPLPLPTVAVNDKAFSSSPEYKYDGQVRAINYRRAIRALKNYGYQMELAEISQKFLDAVALNMEFSDQYDPFTMEATGEVKDGYAPTASAVIEMISDLYGVSIERDRIKWGAYGFTDTSSSEFLCERGGDVYRVLAERETTSAYLNGAHLFTVTSGTRVDTDSFGMSPRVTNITNEALDVVFVYRNHTYSTRLKPSETVQF